MLILLRTLKPPNTRHLSRLLKKKKINLKRRPKQRKKLEKKLPQAKSLRKLTNRSRKPKRRLMPMMLINPRRSLRRKQLNKKLRPSRKKRLLLRRK